MQKIGNITSTADANCEWTNGNVAAGIPPTILDTVWLNTVQRELANVVTVGGLTLDPTNDAQVLAALKLLIRSGVTGVIGDARNAKMTVSTASATATFTADELIVGTALGGAQYRLGSFSKKINLAAGGMDTGTAPASGFIALYATYNPTTQASALLAVNATAAVAPQVYGGANMLTGYTALALVSVWCTSASLLVKGFQRGRNLSLDPIAVLSTSGGAATLQSLNISTAVPINAKSINIGGNTNTSSSFASFLNIYGSNYGAAQVSFATTSTGMTLTLPKVYIDNLQTVYYTYGPAGASQTLAVSMYSI